MTLDSCHIYTLFSFIGPLERTLNEVSLNTYILPVFLVRSFSFFFFLVFVINQYRLSFGRAKLLLGTACLEYVKPSVTVSFILVDSLSGIWYNLHVLHVLITSSTKTI